MTAPIKRNTPYVYVIAHKVTGRIYVGVTEAKYPLTPETDGYYGSGTLISAAVKREGKKSFTKKILKTFGTYVEAQAFESLILDKWFVAQSYNYNIAVGSKTKINRPIPKEDGISSAKEYTKYAKETFNRIEKYVLSEMNCNSETFGDAKRQVKANKRAHRFMNEIEADFPQPSSVTAEKIVVAMKKIGMTKASLLTFEKDAYRGQIRDSIDSTTVAFELKTEKGIQLKNIDKRMKIEESSVDHYYDMIETKPDSRYVQSWREIIKERSDIYEGLEKERDILLLDRHPRDTIQ